MKVLLINSVCGIRSTGRICAELAEKFTADGHTVRIAYGRESVPKEYEKYAIKIGSKLDVYIHAASSRLFDNTGFCSAKATELFLKWADEFNPDLVWLHNLHGYYINVQKLFDWLKSRPQMQVKWTLHDCWSFTGHCTYFTVAKCYKWKTHCQDCPQQKEYPASWLMDRSHTNFERKKNIFTEVKNMELITPSKWLANLVKESFLKDYSVKVVYNTIDKNVFKPTYSDLRKKFHLEEKIIILGVAAFWNRRKGLDDFIELSKMLDDRYAIILVGLSKKQIEEIFKRIMGLKRINSPQKLATVYTNANVIVNHSREESFGMTKLEEVSCGTDAIGYKGTDHREIVSEIRGVAVEEGVENLYEAIAGKVYNANNDHDGVDSIICIQRTNNPTELAELYTIADYFVNPTHEDNFPTVNLEAIACGTDVITYNVGGCVETLKER